MKLTILLCGVVSTTTTTHHQWVAQEAISSDDDVAFQTLAPPSFHTGSVFHSSSKTFDEVDFQTLNLREFDGMTATMYMSIKRWPSPNATINTTPWERIVDTLRENNKVIHGHVLVYPNYNLDIAWWQQQPDNLVESRMYQYIDALASTRSGDIWIWDVVNEVLGDDGNAMDQDGVRTIYRDGRPIKEYQAMGQSFIAKAFRRAHAADPSALLLISDYKCEEDDPLNNNDKSDRMLRFVQKLKRQKVPIHGVGMHVHVSSLPGQEPNYTRIALNFERFRNASIPIFITEMDVKSYKSINTSNVSSKALQQAASRQALVYARVMKICLNEPACKCLFMWDDAEYNSRQPSVKYSWLHPYQDGTAAPIYWFPTPFWDINPNKFSAKPAWYAMRDALSNFTGVYRVTSLWQPQSSYLTRSGPSTPSSQVVLYTLNAKSNSWSSMKWRFERVDAGLYRIACTWGYATGYLTRLGLQDPTTLQYNTSSVVYLQDLHTDWKSQLWVVDYLYDNQYKITSRWGSDGSLTRVGRQDQSGAYQPTNKVNLMADRNFTSQIWRLEQVWSAGNTKTAKDAFWL